MRNMESEKTVNLLGLSRKICITSRLLQQQRKVRRRKMQLLWEERRGNLFLRSFSLSREELIVFFHQAMILIHKS